MAVSYNAFLSWAESRFEHVKTNGKEIMIDSPFPEEMGDEPDHGGHLWCNVDGGKHKRKDGVYRCWKTDKLGTLTGFVMKTDGCTYEEALSLIGGDTDHALIEKTLDDFFKNKHKIDFNINLEEKEEFKLKLPSYTYPLPELLHHSMGKVAIEYLQNRKLPYEDLFFCTRERYKNRIVIPYYGKNGDLIYYNCRDIGNKKRKYLGPPEEIGIGKGDVLFMTDWPEKGSVIYICEGEFDAMSLKQCGFFGAAVGGKSLSDQQVDLLRGYKIVLALDNDPAGIRAVFEGMGHKLLEEGGFPVSFVIPPKNFKDWNAMLEKMSPNVIIAYINKSSNKFTRYTAYSSDIIWR